MIYIRDVAHAVLIAAWLKRKKALSGPGLSTGLGAIETPSPRERGRGLALGPFELVGIHPWCPASPSFQTAAEIVQLDSIRALRRDAPARFFNKDGSPQTGGDRTEKPSGGCAGGGLHMGKK